MDASSIVFKVRLDRALNSTYSLRRPIAGCTLKDSSNPNGQSSFNPSFLPSNCQVLILDRELQGKEPCISGVLWQEPGKVIRRLSVYS